MATYLTTERDIRYYPATHDYALYLNGDLVGYSRTYTEGETALDRLVYDALIASPLSETEALAAEIAEQYGLALADALDIAGAKLAAVLAYAARWDEQTRAQRSVAHDNLAA